MAPIGDDGVPVVLGHLVEDDIAQYAGIVDHAIDAAETVERALDDLTGGSEPGYAIVAGNSLTSVFPDFSDHFLCGRLVAALATERGADVVHHDPRPVLRHQLRDRRADPAAGAGHHYGFPFNYATHYWAPLLSNSGSMLDDSSGDEKWR